MEFRTAKAAHLFLRNKESLQKLNLGIVMPWIQRLGGTTKAATSRPGHYVCETTQTMGFERRKTILFTYICY